MNYEGLFIDWDFGHPKGHLKKADFDPRAVFKKTDLESCTAASEKVCS